MARAAFDHPARGEQSQTTHAAGYEVRGVIAQNERGRGLYRRRAVHQPRHVTRGLSVRDLIFFVPPADLFDKAEQRVVGIGRGVEVDTPALKLEVLERDHSAQGPYGGLCGLHCVRAIARRLGAAGHQPDARGLGLLRTGQRLYQVKCTAASQCLPSLKIGGSCIQTPEMHRAGAGSSVLRQYVQQSAVMRGVGGIQTVLGRRECVECLARVDEYGGLALTADGRREFSAKAGAVRVDEPVTIRFTRREVPRVVGAASENQGLRRPLLVAIGGSGVYIPESRFFEQSAPFVAA